jgi:phosphopantetheine--protein transferase-like protein
MSQARSAKSRAPHPDRLTIAIGIDVVEIDAVRRLLSHGVSRLRRVFTPVELRGCGVSRFAIPRIARLACVFAAKEAVFKALGRGWGQGMRWNEVCVVRLPDCRWAARLGGNAERRFRELGGSSLEIAAGAGRGYAMACAMIYGSHRGHREHRGNV